jgi:hypothetical protein
MELGFDNWYEAHTIISGSMPPLSRTNLGSFFYPENCESFINEWFSDYSEARKIQTPVHRKNG